mmetsp:Transcript_15231/g.42300  ORF Transcript_15231/g.42300 Transcript_15231/m.42300 type:complete len:82 (+) Transcript_15231:573-818(+)
MLLSCFGVKKTRRRSNEHVYSSFPIGFTQTSSENTSSLQEELNHPKTSSSRWLRVGTTQDAEDLVGSALSTPSTNRNPTIG